MSIWNKLTPGRKRRAVEVQKSAYSMATSDGISAELTLYGDIYEERPIDWWTGKPSEGQFITLSEFMEDMKQIENCKDITIRVNSYGGDAMVSNTIHNRLRELARNGAELTCIVDGVAMSGGSLIMCACDHVKVNPSSLIMVHRCWSFVWGCYNADEMLQMAEQNTAWDKMQIAIYQRKTGLSEEEIAGMMAETTYMTGREAAEKGFADEVLEDADPLEIAASADGRSLFFNGREMHMAPGLFAPDHIPTVKAGAAAPDKANRKQPEVTGGEKGGNPMTMEEIRAQYPDLVAQIEGEAKAAGSTEAVSAAVQVEQERLQEIDQVASLFDDALVQEAKYGETACSAQELAYRAAMKAAQQGKKFLVDLEADAKQSGAAGVAAAPIAGERLAAEGMTPEQRLADARAEVKALFGKKEGGN